MQNGLMLTWHIVGLQHIIAVWLCCSEASAGVFHEAVVGMWVQKAGQVLGAALSWPLSLAGLECPPIYSLGQSH